MAAFTACLIAAGAILSLLTRVQGFVLVLGGLLLAVASAAILSPALGTGAGLPLTLLVAVIALQAGYGLGVILRATLGRRSHAARDRDQPQTFAEASEAAAHPRRSPQDGGPLNHP